MMQNVANSVTFLSLTFIIYVYDNEQFLLRFSGKRNITLIVLPPNRRMTCFSSSKVFRAKLLCVDCKIKVKRHCDIIRK